MPLTRRPDGASRDLRVDVVGTIPLWTTTLDNQSAILTKTPSLPMNSSKAREASFAAWPHDRPAASDLAAAGFYYIGDPAEDDDTVRCFLCAKEMGGWEVGDDPLSEHLAHGKSKNGCPWALLMSEKRSPSNDPVGPVMLKAREATFKGWPHEKERGWLGKGKRMARAGLHYSPSTESTDAVECIYCGVELDGWEKNDDPLVEHERRAAGLSCAFFVGLLPLVASQSILEMTKGAFAQERRRQENIEINSSTDATDDVQFIQRQTRKASIIPLEVERSAPLSEKKKPTKRRLPGTKGKKPIVMIDEQSDDERPSEQPLPIVLKSARKKRPSADTNPEDIDRNSTTPVKKTRLRRGRSNSTSNFTNLSDALISGDTVSSEKQTSRPRARRARTPLEEIIEPNHVESCPVPIGTISEEPVDKIGGSGHIPPIIETSICTRKNAKLATSKESKRSSTTRRKGTGVREFIDDQLPEKVVQKELITSQTVAHKCVPLEYLSDPLEVDEIFMGELDTQEPLDPSGQAKAFDISPNSVEQPVYKEEQSQTSPRGRNTMRPNAKHVEVVIFGSSSSQPPEKRVDKGGSQIKVEEEQDVVASSLSASALSAPAQRRRSSRRRGSGTASASESKIEEVLMLDHKSKPRAQRSSQIASNSIRSHVPISTDSIVEEEDEELQSCPVPPVAAHIGQCSEIFETEDLQRGSNASENELMSDIEDPDAVQALEPASTVYESPARISEVITAPIEGSNSPYFKNNKEVSAIDYAGATARDEPIMLDILDTENKFEHCHWIKPYRELCNIEPMFGQMSHRIDNLSEDEKRMTVEQWMRHYAIEETRLLEATCEKMIETLMFAGERARQRLIAST